MGANDANGLFIIQLEELRLWKEWFDDIVYNINLACSEVKLEYAVFPTENEAISVFAIIRLKMKLHADLVEHFQIFYHNFRIQLKSHLSFLHIELFLVNEELICLVFTHD